MKRLRHIPFVLLLATMGCQTPSPKKATSSSVRDWSADLARETPDAPFQALYQRNDHTLTYLGVRHENDLSSSSMQLISNTFAKKKFDVVLLEGFPSAKGKNPESMKTEALQDGKNGFFQEGETGLSIQLAVKYGVAFIGAEPDENEVETSILKAGYTKQDLLFFYLVRQIPEFRRQKKLTILTNDDLFNQFLKNWSRTLEVDPTPDLKTFFTWYKEKNGKAFNVDDIDTEVPAPLGTGKLFTQRLSAVVGRRRNEFIVDQITTAVHQYKSVLVIFGASHWATQRLALEDLMGKPEVSTFEGQSPNRTSATVSHDPHEAVVTYHPTADEIGYEILNHGGNAFDAFVASTAAQYVLGEGVTSFAGPLGALLFDARSKSVVYLDATFNDPINPKHKVDLSNPQPGASVLVPGAVAGLEAISKRYGRLSFKKVLEPAIQLAENGFPLNDQYAGLLKSEYGKRLKRSAYAAKTYFRNGEPLAKGEMLKLPAVAKFLKRIASKGSRYVYNGPWASECLKEVNKQGGHLTLKDFSSYKAEWKTPAKISYHGYEIYSPANNGGINTLLSLKVLEQTDLTKLGTHYSSNLEALATMALIQDEVTLQPWLYDEEKLKDLAFVEMKLSDSTANEIWKSIQQKIVSANKESTGSHSYHIVVIDKEGNAITGTNTIESFPWGNDIFVEGIPLTASGELPFGTKPGQRRRSPLSMQIGMAENKVRFAVGAFSASLLPAEFQFVTNIVDYKLSAHDVVSTPRFGSHAWDMQTRKQVDGIWLDPRVDKSIVEALKKKGLKFTQDGYIDTGLGSVAIVDDDGRVTGAIAPMTSIGQSATKIVGIGAALDFNSQQKIYVREIFPGSPAERTGLKVGDIILAVQTNPSSAMTPISNKSIQDVLSMIRGPLGVPVNLNIDRSGATQVIQITREEIITKRLTK
jgi:gamma-glutamyltranspeptidase/glutathione hydrolase